jgi:hypothetical protein
LEANSRPHARRCTFTLLLSGVFCSVLILDAAPEEPRNISFTII